MQAITYIAKFVLRMSINFIIKNSLTYYLSLRLQIKVLHKKALLAEQESPIEGT